LGLSQTKVDAIVPVQRTEPINILVNFNKLHRASLINEICSDGIVL